MIFFLLTLLFIIISSAEIAAPNQFMKDYISKERTNAIKGIFVILIVFSHASQYINLTGIYDEPYIIFKNHIHQMVVAMFFFYSGFGMMKQILSKKFEYIKSIPFKRLFVLLVNLDIAVVIFLILQYFLGRTFELKTILLSLIGWENVGNSNWYMFAIFAVYILMFISFYILRWIDKKAVYYIGTAILTVLTMAFVFWEMKMGLDHWWYDTVILFPLGCWYALFQEQIEKIVMRNDYVYSLICACIALLYCVGYIHRWEQGIEKYTVWAVAFTLAVVFFTMKVSIDNKMLNWFGEHIFSIYILQRIPMLILVKFGFATNHKYMFIIVSILFTVFISMVFDYFVGKLNKKIIQRKGE